MLINKKYARSLQFEYEDERQKIAVWRIVAMYTSKLVAKT